VARRALLFGLLASPPVAGDVDRSALLVVVALGALCWVLLPVARVVAGRRPTTLPRTVRGANGPLSWISTLWWAPALLLIGQAAHGNVGGPHGREQPELLQVLLVLVPPVLLILYRRRTRVELTEAGMRWTTVGSAVVPDARPPSDVLPLGPAVVYQLRTYLLYGVAILVCLAEGRWYLSAAAIVISLVVGVVALRFPSDTEQISWDDVTPIAGEAGNVPILVMRHSGSVDLAPLLVSGTAGDQLTRVVLDHAQMRPPGDVDGPVPRSTEYAVVAGALAVIIGAAVVYAAFDSHLLDLPGGDGSPVRDRATIERTQRVQRVMPENRKRTDGGPPELSCIDDGLDTCPLSPELRRVVETGATPVEQAALLCRCDADGVAHAVANDEQDAPDPPGGSYVRATLIDYSGDTAQRTYVRISYDEDRETVTDVVCLDADRAPVGSGLAEQRGDGVDVDRLRCAPV
jgi:hypothetical protein